MVGGALVVVAPGPVVSEVVVSEAVVSEAVVAPEGVLVVVSEEQARREVASSSAEPAVAMRRRVFIRGPFWWVGCPRTCGTRCLRRSGLVDVAHGSRVHLTS